MAKRMQADELVEEQPAEAVVLMEAQPAEAVVLVEAQPAEAVVLVEALVPMWGGNDVVPPGTRYHLPQPTAEYLANMGFVVMVQEEAD